MLSTKDIQVCIQTTWWKTKENEFGFHSGWPNPDYEEKQLQAYNDLLNNDAKFAKWRRKNGEPPRVVSVSLHTALTHPSKVSAYLVQYKPTVMAVRLRTTLFDAKYREAYSMYKDVSPKGVEMHIAIFDMDCHGGDVEKWFAKQKPRIDRLQADFPGLLCWRSKNGFRVLGVLPEPFCINSRDDAKEWTRLYTAWCKFLARKYMLTTEGKDTPDQLGDWTRYQRVPHDTRIKGQPASDLPFYGNPEFVGYWNPELITEDWPAKVAPRSTEHLEYQGHCQLHTLIVNAGLRCDDTNNPAIFDIHCPNHQNHSESEDRKTKTYLYVNGPIGKIECKSSSCSASHQDKMKSYLQHFSPEAVKATSPARNWRNQPLVAEILDKRIRMQREATLDTMEENPVDETYTELKAAVSNAINMKERTAEDVKAFSKWFVNQKTYTDHKCPMAWAHWLDSCIEMH